MSEWSSGYELEEDFTEWLEDGGQPLPALKVLINTSWDYLSEEDRIELARFVGQ